MHHNITEMKKISTHLFADVLGIDDKQNKSLTTTATFANSGKNAFAQCSGRVQIGTMRILFLVIFINTYYKMTFTIDIINLFENLQNNQFQKMLEIFILNILFKTTVAPVAQLVSASYL
ncbi:hypothetical protein T06_2856 [Trichinella sp. T6]|nr:hypothetical protein T06_2856 [Trichinella sp. T6]